MSYLCIGLDLDPDQEAELEAELEALANERKWSYKRVIEVIVTNYLNGNLQPNFLEPDRIGSSTDDARAAALRAFAAGWDARGTQ